MSDPESRRVPPVAIGLLALVVLSGIAVLGLAALTGGGDGTRRTARPTSTTVATEPTTTTTTEPRPTTYRVRRGDNLTSIANRFRVSVAALAVLNELSDQDLLTPGQVLRIPPAAPLRLVVQPATTTPGTSVRIVLTGARPGEDIAFEIRKPDGVFRGDPHVATDRGRVETSFRVDPDDPPGDYLILVHGGLGTELTRGLTVTAPPPPPAP